MCTYNGESYLQEQLNSMLIQSTLPDELIVCDDGSVDKTIEIIETFKISAPFLVRLYKNDTQTPLRPTKNFERAISLCKGEMIVLCDQDDVWYPNKLSLLQKAIDDGMGLVFSNADLVDAHLNSLDDTLFGSFNLSNIENSLLKQNKVFEILVKRNIVTGAATAFSNRYLPLILPISENWVHDGWLGILIASMGKVKVISEPLFQYRQHSKNQIGAKKLNFKQKINRVKKLGNVYYLELLNGFIEARSKLINLNPEMTESSVIKLLDKKIIHLTKRSKLAVSPSFPIVSLTLELFACSYHKFSRGYISYCRDLAMMVLNKID